MCLLRLDKDSLSFIIKKNNDVWNDAEVPEHLLHLKQEHPDLPIDPDMPPTWEVAKAIYFLKQEHLPASLLGEWQYPIPPEIKSLGQPLPPAITMFASSTSIDTQASAPIIPESDSGCPFSSPTTPVTWKISSTNTYSGLDKRAQEHEETNRGRHNQVQSVRSVRSAHNQSLADEVEDGITVEYATTNSSSIPSVLNLQPNVSTQLPGTNLLRPTNKPPGPITPQCSLK
jgi:hypothetical protein